MILKKLILPIFILLLAFGLNLNSPLTFAQADPADEIFHATTVQNKGSKIDYVQQLPGGDWQSILTSVIKFVLGITGTLALISFTVAGVLFLTARGEEDQITKAKNLLIWSIAALGIIAVSYAIVLGVSQLKFFS